MDIAQYLKAQQQQQQSMPKRNLNNNNGRQQSTTDEQQLHQPDTRLTLEKKDHSVLKNEKKLFNTDSLDEAMQELIEICQLHNETNLSTMRGTKQTAAGNDENPQDSSAIDDKQNLMLNNKSSRDNISRIMTTNNCDNQERNSVRKNDVQCASNNDWTATSSGSIEKLQRRQSDLQAQLDEVLQVAKQLAARQKRKLKCIFEDGQEELKRQQGRVPEESEEEEEEEDELVEFQQIENELRISELNRQLDNIQEELRIRLYKRLLTNANGSARPKPQPQIPPSVHHPSRRGSSHTDESSPSSSSCSEEPTPSSTTSTSTTNEMSSASSNRPRTNDSEYRQHVDLMTGLSSRETESFNRYRPPASRSQSIRDGGTCNYNSNHQTSLENSEITTNYQALDSVIESMHESLELESLTPTNSKESVNSISKKNASLDVQSNIYSTNNSAIHTPATIPGSLTHASSPLSLSNHRNNSANSDLERIEEDEEDCQDYYSNSDHFRTIYEEKLSPMIQASSANCSGNFNSIQHDSLTSSVYERSPKAESSFLQTQDGYTEEKYRDLSNQYQVSRPYIDLTDASPTTNKFAHRSDNNNDSFKRSNESASSSNTSRPLTLYLPKPDEEVDLIEHVQALGHDLSIISSDLKLNPSCAHGYLWKSCSKNTKKWLKRYFYFDRRLKTLSYYESEGHLVKKQGSPKNSVSFDEICDVYVDHKLSGIGEKDRSSKRKNYVFVLATIGRKYLLASSRAETMRAWIDILFTAAKANDYFQQLDDVGVEDG